MKDRVVVITGGSSGIGKALAEVFGKNGSRVIITGRKLDVLKETQKRLSDQGLDVHIIQSDVSQEADNQKMAQEVLDKFGKIDVLINNAGITMRALFNEVDLDVVKKVMDINFYGVLYATKYCLPSIIENKGAVIGISSIAGFRGLPGRTGYSASKFALQGFLEVLRTELLHKDVHVLTACPGFTASNIRKSSLTKDGSAQGESPRDEQKMMAAERCAELIYKALKKKKRYLILTSQGKLTVWLNRFLPGLTDKLVYKVMAKEADAPIS